MADPERISNSINVIVWYSGVIAVMRNCRIQLADPKVDHPWPPLLQVLRAMIR